MTTRSKASDANADKTIDKTSDEIPKSQAKINEELFRFRSEFKEELGDLKSKLDILLSMAQSSQPAKNVTEMEDRSAPILPTPSSSLIKQPGNPQLLKPDYDSYEGEKKNSTKMERNCATGKTRGGSGKRGRGKAKRTHQEMVLGSDDVYTASPHKVSGPLNEITKSDSLKSGCGSYMICSKRSEDKQLSSPMDLSEDHVAQTQVTVASRHFNLREVAKDEDDEDGIESSIDPALVEVKGYHEGSEMELILPRILEQHGDIAKDCDVKASRECYLEKVCCVYLRLQRSSFEAIESDDLLKMRETIDDLVRKGLNVKWLSERLGYILESKVFFEVLKRKKKEFKKVNDQLVTLRKTMAPIEQRHSVLDEEIKNMKAEDEKIQIVRNLLNRPLVDGLI